MIFRDSGLRDFEGAGSDRLNPGERLNIGQQITSPSGRVYLVMQGDHHLVTYVDGSNPLWGSGGWNSDAVYAEFQTDGNLVLYNPNRTARWASGTNGRGGVRLVIQDDGNLVIYNASGGAVWSSIGNAGGKAAPPPPAPAAPAPAPAPSATPAPTPTAPSAATQINALAPSVQASYDAAKADLQRAANATQQTGAGVATRAAAQRALTDAQATQDAALAFNTAAQRGDLAGAQAAAAAASANAAKTKTDADGAIAALAAEQAQASASTGQLKTLSAQARAAYQAAVKDAARAIAAANAHGAPKAADLATQAQAVLNQIVAAASVATQAAGEALSSYDFYGDTVADATAAANNAATLAAQLKTIADQAVAEDIAFVATMPGPITAGPSGGSSAKAPSTTITYGPGGTATVSKPGVTTPLPVQASMFSSPVVLLGLAAGAFFLLGRK